MALLTPKQRRKRCDKCFMHKREHPKKGEKAGWWTLANIRPHEFTPSKPVDRTIHLGFWISPKEVKWLRRTFMQPLCVDAFVVDDQHNMAITNYLILDKPLDSTNCPDCIRRYKNGSAAIIRAQALGVAQQGEKQERVVITRAGVRLISRRRKTRSK